MTAATPIELPHSFELYIPTQCRCGQPLPAAERENVFAEAKQRMLAWFGGANVRSEPIRGLYQMKTGERAGELAEELNDVICSFASDENFEDHREEFVAYAAELANRLTQESILCRVKGKTLIYPSTQNSKPHRCALGSAPVKLPEPLSADAIARAKVLQASLQRIDGLDDARDLFCNILHYEYTNEILPTRDWPDSVKQCLAPGTAPQIIADQNGFKIIYLQLADATLRKAQERQIVQRILKDIPDLRGLVAVSDVTQKHWNLVNVKFTTDKKKQTSVILRRMRVGRDQLVRTAVERLLQVDVEIVGEKATAAQLQEAHDRAFDVEAVTKQFYNDIANWYFWALKHAEFPKDAPKEDDGHDHISLIRLITRLIFCWFLREKGLMPDELFDRRKLQEILTGFTPEKVSNKDSVYYRAILQNLFFATLNTETDKRAWVKDDQHFMAHSLYRFKECFQKPGSAMELFKSVPFLNGGLFECLDKDRGENAKPRYERIDGFSRRADSQPTVPDFLFFGPEREVDLSKEYDNKKFKSVTVRGLIDTLRHYNFTIEENTPIEQEVALDPELCGKVFENLLAAYNPETGATARKQTGSFYTPREIVNYMVDEALIASLKTKLEAAVPAAKEVEARLRQLFSYDEPENPFAPAEMDALIAAIDSLKTLDPAVGSGAFPMGLLHKLVFVLGKLDPDNAKWRERQRQRALQETGATFKLGDKEQREERLKDINAVFEQNASDYGRKLYLIENCIYGVDIQAIAVQIAKMRFFISLIVDQKIDDRQPNRGVRPLPNLETKFVTANSLIGLEKPESQGRLFSDPKLAKLTSDLADLRHRMFTAKNSLTKQRLRDKDDSIRAEMAGQLKATFARAAREEEQKLQTELEQAEADFAAAKAAPPEWHVQRNQNLFGETEETRVDLSKDRKQQLKNRIDDLESRLSRTTQATKEIDVIAKQLANWDPYDQNASADFFDAEWMFGITEGFDVLIGNPPWGAELSGEMKELLKARYPAIDSSTPNSFAYFIGAATQFANNQIAYVLPDALLIKDYARTRQFIRDWVTRIDWYLNTGIPDEARSFIYVEHDVCVLHLDLTRTFTDCLITKHLYDATGSKSCVDQHRVSKDMFILPQHEYCFNLLITKSSHKLMLELETGVPLGDITQCHEGIHTGNARDILFHPRKVNTHCKPLFYGARAGDQIANYYSKTSGWFVDYRESIVKEDKGYYASLRDERIFKLPKIYITRTGNPIKAFFDSHTYASNNFFSLQFKEYSANTENSLKAILPLILSSLANYYVRHFAAPRLGNTYVETKIIHLNRIPVCQTLLDQTEVFAKLTDLIIVALKNENKPVAAFLESLIDACVMECYFTEHMAERDLLLLADIAPKLASFDAAASRDSQCRFLSQFHQRLNSSSSKIRDRLSRIEVDSPDLLAVIKAEGRS